MKAAALILTMMVLSSAFSFGQSKPASAPEAEYGFTLSGAIVSAVSSTLNYEWMNIVAEESLELETWMVDFGTTTEAFVEETEAEPQLERWMTEPSAWERQ